MNTHATRSPFPRLRTLLAAPLLAMLVAACGGGAGVSENPAPASSTQQPQTYSGPAAASADVQAFKVNLWDNLQATNRCGQCHVAGQQAPQFVRRDDINLAYQAANPIVDLNNPGNSRIVQKVAGGHNCWLSSAAACADQITVWIRNWAGSSTGTTRTITLQAPVIREVGNSKSFPTSPAAFGSTVHPVLTQYCSRCHSSSSATPQSPFFASADVDAAYSAARPKINLDTPADSRLVVRLREEFHNCWGDCASNANQMQAAIEAFAGQVPVTQVDPALVLSKALTLYDGTVASGGSRYDSNVIALYEFKTGTGTVAYDTSGVEPALNLTLSGDVSWFGGWGINVVRGKAQGTTTGSRKLHDLIKATGEYSVEAWVAPTNVTQEDAHIIGYSGGTTARNFTLAQRLYDYEFLHRSTTTSGNGTPDLSTPTAQELLQASLQHVVATYDPVNGRRLYVNGTLVQVTDPQRGGAMTDWNDTFALVLGNEVSNDRPWSGVLRLVAIHGRALTLTQVQQNFTAGVGERFYLLFNVESLTGIPRAYVMFEVSQYDTYSYLFDKPALISLDPAVRPDGLRVRGMRIGVNGAEARVGQAYANLDVVVNSSGYDAARGFPLANGGTIIALDKGPAADLFFLTFEQLGSNTNVRTEPALIPLPPPADGVPLPDIGLKTFEEIDASMSAMTTVPRTRPEAVATYDTVRQQLPTVENIEAFLASHQVGVAQLAIEYCNALAEDTTLRASYFPGVDFAAPAATMFDTPAERNLLIDPLVSRAIGTGITTQPSSDEVRTELDQLISGLSGCGAACATAERTRTVVKAACAAVLGSASTLLQ